MVVVAVVAVGDSIGMAVDGGGGGGPVDCGGPAVDQVAVGAVAS